MCHHTFKFSFVTDYLLGVVKRSAKPDLRDSFSTMENLNLKAI